MSEQKLYEPTQFPVDALATIFQDPHFKINMSCASPSDARLELNLAAFQASAVALSLSSEARTEPGCHAAANHVSSPVKTGKQPVAVDAGRPVPPAPHVMQRCGDQ